MEENPIGTTPVTTVEESEQRIAKLQADLAQANLERDQAREKELAANRKIEATRKFEKLEEFQTSVIKDIDSLKEVIGTKLPALEKENQDLKEILKTQGAITPSISTATPTAPAPQVPTAEETRLNQMFGLPVTKP